MKAKATKQAFKQAYVSPSVEIIMMENEGVIAASGLTEDYTPTPISRSSYRGYNAASSNDLEDLVNELFTVEN